MFLKLLLVLASSALAASEILHTHVISLDQGQVSGVIETSKNGRPFHSFYGIPYAKPPLDDLRFMDPIPSDGWEGVRECSKMPPPCLPVSIKYLVQGIRVSPDRVLGDEDCLYLNVFTPQTSNTALLPVMVWIHGGAFISGGANEYLPHVLLDRDVVLVVLQYRLGVLGFLSTEDSVAPGNQGLKDQNLALQWVQRNIHHLGGDPSMVTIFGESAGGASVHYHMLAPKSKNLFSRVIMQSGSAISPWAVLRPGEHLAMARLVARTLGCPTTSTQTLVACVQQADAREVAATLQESVHWLLMPDQTVPRIDGDFVPEDAASLMLQGRFNPADVMAGITRDEGAIATHPMFANKIFLQNLQENFTFYGPVSVCSNHATSDPLQYATDLYERYLGHHFTVAEHNADAITQLLTDHHFAIPHDITTQFLASANHGKNTYRYEFQHRGQLSFGDYFGIEIGKHWVTHADDLLYLFSGGPLLSPPWLKDRPSDLSTSQDLRLRDIMVELWVNFATTGNPTPDSSLGFTWDAATPENLHFLSLTPNPSMKPDNRKEIREFHMSLPNALLQRLKHSKDEL